MAKVEEIKTVGSKNVEKVRKDYLVLFDLTDEKIDDILELVDYGRNIADSWRIDRGIELGRKISKICGVDKETSSSIFNVVLNILRGFSKKGFVSNRASDLKKLGFKRSDVKRFQRIARILKEQKAAKEIVKLDAWRDLSTEVLPELYMLEYSYSIRCNISRGKVKENLPMVLIKIITTSPEETARKEVTFQTTIGDLRFLARTFNTMYKEARLLRKYGVQPERGKK